MEHLRALRKAIWRRPGRADTALCLSVFPWAHFRSTKAAVKMHTLLDLRGSIPSFIHVSDGRLHDVHALDLLIPEPGAIYVMDRGYVVLHSVWNLSGCWRG